MIPNLLFLVIIQFLYIGCQQQSRNLEGAHAKHAEKAEEAERGGLFEQTKFFFAANLISLTLSRWKKVLH